MAAVPVRTGTAVLTQTANGAQQVGSIDRYMGLQVDDRFLFYFYFFFLGGGVSGFLELTLHVMEMFTQASGNIHSAQL